VTVAKAKGGVDGTRRQLRRLTKKQINEGTVRLGLGFWVIKMRPRLGFRFRIIEGGSRRRRSRPRKTTSNQRSRQNRRTMEPVDSQWSRPYQIGSPVSMVVNKQSVQ
jgi:hypothetical protein